MGKRETKETYKTVQEAQKPVLGQYGDLSTGAAQNVGNIAPFVAKGREDLSAGYGNMANGGMAIGAPGQVSTGRMDNVYNQFGEIAQTGGYSEGTRRSILENVGGLKQIGATGGYDPESTARARGLGGFEQIQNEGGLSPEAQDRMRGGGGYDEFAATGGYDPTARANIRAKAIGAVGSLATGQRDEMDRRRVLQNNYAPGFDAANRALQRDTSRAIAETSLNADITLQDKINQGRQFGIGGMAQSEGNLQGMRTGNILNATQGLSAAEQGLVMGRTGNQMRGLESASQIESDLSARIAQFRLQGMSGQQASAAAMAEVEGRNIDRGIGVQQFNVGTQQAGMAGMGNLYNTDIAQMQAERDRQLALINAGHTTNQGYLGLQGQLANPGGEGNWSKIISGIGTAAGVASDWFKKGANVTGGSNSGGYAGPGGSGISGTAPPGVGGQPGGMQPFPPPGTRQLQPGYDQNRSTVFNPTYGQEGWRSRGDMSMIPEAQNISPEAQNMQMQREDRTYNTRGLGGWQGRNVNFAEAQNQIDPNTGQPYEIDPRTGQPYQKRGYF